MVIQKYNISSINQADPDTRRAIRLEAAELFRPVFREDKISREIEDSGITEYKAIPEFSLNESGQVEFVSGAYAGRTLADLDRRTKELAPRFFKDTDVSTNSLIQASFRSGASTVVTSYHRDGRDNRDVIVMEYDRLRNHGVMRVINTGRNNTFHLFSEIRDIAKTRFRNLSEISLTQQVFVLTDSNLILAQPNQDVTPVRKRPATTPVPYRVTDLGLGSDRLPEADIAPDDVKGNSPAYKSEYAKRDAASVPPEEAQVIPESNPLKKPFQNDIPDRVQVGVKTDTNLQILNPNSSGSADPKRGLSVTAQFQLTVISYLINTEKYHDDAFKTAVMIAAVREIIGSYSETDTVTKTGESDSYEGAVTVIETVYPDTPNNLPGQSDRLTISIPDHVAAQSGVSAISAPENEIRIRETVIFSMDDSSFGQKESRDNSEPADLSVIIHNTPELSRSEERPVTVLKRFWVRTADNPAANSSTKEIVYIPEITNDHIVQNEVVNGHRNDFRDSTGRPEILSWIQTAVNQDMSYPGYQEYGTRLAVLEELMTGWLLFGNMMLMLKTDDLYAPGIRSGSGSGILSGIKPDENFIDTLQDIRSSFLEMAVIPWLLKILYQLAYVRECRSPGNSMYMTQGISSFSGIMTGSQGNGIFRQTADEIGDSSHIIYIYTWNSD